MLFQQTVASDREASGSGIESIPMPFAQKNGGWHFEPEGEAESSVQEAVPESGSEAQDTVAILTAKPARSSAARCKVRDLAEWMEEMRLEEYLEAASDWCAEMGAVSLEEIAENIEDFGKDISLKPIERQRVQKWAAQKLPGAVCMLRDNFSFGSFGKDPPLQEPPRIELPDEGWNEAPRAPIYTARSVRLAVDSQGNTGLDLRFDDEWGIRVESVDPLPGQPGLAEGDFIVAIEGHSLRHKSHEECDAIFSERLQNGVLLSVVRPASQSQLALPKQPMGSWRLPRQPDFRNPSWSRRRGGHDANRMWNRFNRGPPWCGGHVKRMTTELVQDICKERSMWSQPHLNTQLYLNYKGFETIECLEAYSNLRALYLGNNNIARIDGLDRMSDLRSLHLEGNRIRCIENLTGNLELRQLSLESNAIRSLSGLSHLTKLQHLNVAKNALSELSDLKELESLPSLENLDVSHNCIEASEGVVDFWVKLPAELKILRYHGNPGVRFIEHYRKRLVNALPALRYLDERPIFPVERKASAAWQEGGLEALQKAKRDHFQEQCRLQNSVDPERREFLTQQRKLAIARIEREERERLEGAEEEKGWTAAQKGDEEALAAYARTWREKLECCGAEKLRDEVATSGSGQSKAAALALAEAQRKAQEEKCRLNAVRQNPAPTSNKATFSPPPRDSGCAPSAANASNVAGFRQSRSEDWAERQLSLLGEDEPEAARPEPREPVEPVPDLWKKVEQQNKEAEGQVLELNAAASAGP
ncbi:unnamed protein product [Effrenium voratum]|nr:unnamed protein product [Effrenium voratum]